MADNYPALSTKTVPATLLRPNRAIPQAGIVHIGLGNFHRAHQAAYTNAAIASHGGDWGVIGVASRSRRVVDALRRQDLLYTVIEVAPTGNTFSVPAVHSEVFTAAQEPERLITAIGAATTRIVSLTVTENGYTFSPSTGRLDFDNPDVRHDLANRNSPRSVIGQVSRGLQQRMLNHDEPLTVLSCDNLTSNGRLTKRLVTDFATRLPGAEGAQLAEWIEARVTFPSSMVDRIVPATTDQQRQLVRAELGYTDAVPVAAEPFSMWIVEDEFAAGRPQWESGGVVFSSEVGNYEQLKLRLLNGTHSLIAYLGALSGCVTIPDAVATVCIESAARAVLRNEYLPSVTLPAGVDAPAYEEELFTRWQNSALGHRTDQVGSDGSVKLPQRIYEPAIRMLDLGIMPQYLALTVAAYLCCVAPLPRFQPGENAKSMVDPARPRLAALAATARNGVDLAKRVFDQGRIFQHELGERPEFVERVGEYIDIIVGYGAQAASRAAREASDADSHTVAGPILASRAGGE